MWTSMLIFVSSFLSGGVFSMPGLTFSTLVVPGTLLSFFMMMTFRAAYTRFLDVYSNCTACIGRLVDIAELCASYLPKSSHPLHAWDINRYCHAAHMLGYIGLSDTFHNLKIFPNWLQSENLLTNEEISVLEGFNPSNSVKGFKGLYFQVIKWALDVVHEAHRAGLLTELEAWSLQQQILSLRGSMAQLYFKRQQPTPYR